MRFCRELKLACLLLVATMGFAQQTTRTKLNGITFQEKADRLLEIVYGNPTQGSAFDLLYQHYVDAGLVHKLDAKTETRAAVSDDFAAQIVRGMFFEKLAKYDEAIQILSHAKKLDDHFVPSLIIGTIYLRQQRFEEAANELSNIPFRKMRPQEYLLAKKQLAMAYVRAHQFSNAVKTWKAIAARFPADTRVLEEVATIMGNEGEFEEATKLWRRIKRQKPNDEFHQVKADIRIAKLQIDQRKISEARESLSLLLTRIKPDSWSYKEVCALIKTAILEQQNADEYVLFWESQLKRADDNLATRKQMALAYAYAGRNSEALTTLQDALVKGPRNYELRELYIQFLVRASRWDEAISQAKILADQNRNNIEVWLRLGNLYLDQKADKQSFTNAIESWDHIATINESVSRYAVEAANACTNIVRARGKIGDHEKQLAAESTKEYQLLIDAAEKHFREAIRRNPKAAEYHEYLGEFLFWIGRPDDARKAFAKMALANTAEAWHQLSRVYATYEFWDHAIEAGSESLKRNPANPDYIKDQVDLLVRIKDFERAFQQIHQLKQLAKDPSWEETALRLHAETAKAANRIASEIKKFQKSGGAKKTYRDHWQLAMLLIQKDALSPALNQMHSAVELAPQHERLRGQFAALLVTTQNQDAAIVEYRQCIALNPLRKRYYLRQIIDLQLRLNRRKEAIQSIQELIAAAPMDAESYVLMAMVAARTKNYSGQVDALKKAVRLSPDDVSMRHSLAMALRSAGQREEANAQAFRSFEIADTLAQKQSMLAFILKSTRHSAARNQLIERLQQKRLRASDPFEMTMCLYFVCDHLKLYDKALEELVHAQKIRQYDEAVLQQIVDYAERHGQIRLAVQYQERLVAIDDSARANERLASLYRSNGQVEAANRIWNRLMDGNLTVVEILDMAEEKLRKPNLQQTQMILEMGLAKHPKSWRLNYLLGLVHSLSNRREQSRASFAAVIEHTKTDQKAFALYQQQFSGHANSSTPSLVSGNLLLPPSARNQSAAAIPKPYYELHAAINAQSVYFGTQFTQIVLSPRTRSQRSRQRTLSQNVTRPDMLTARMNSALALFAGQHDEFQNWIRGLTTDLNANPADIRMMMLISWISGQSEFCQILLERAMQRDHSDAVPHIIQILLVDRANEKERGIDAITSSYSWLREHHPEIARDLFSIFVQRIDALGSNATTAKIAQQEIQIAQAFFELPILIKLLPSPTAGGDADQFALKAWQLASEKRETVSQYDLEQVLRCIVAYKTSSQESRDCMLSLFALYMSKSKIDPKRFPQSRPRNLGAEQIIAQYNHALAFRSFLSNKNLANPNPRQLAFLHYQLRQSSRGQRFTVTKKKISRVNSRTRKNGRFGFPSRTTTFDANRMAIFQLVQKHCEQNDCLPQFFARMESHASDSANPDQNVFLLAKAYTYWNTGKRNECMAILNDLAEDPACDRTIRFALVRAHLEQKNLRHALKVLNTIQLTPGNATTMTLLRNTIAENWSDLAFVREFKGHNGAVSKLLFGNHGKQIVSCGLDGTVRFWNVDDGSESGVIDGHGDLVLDIALSPDGKSLASAGYDQHIRLWDMDSREPIGVLKHHKTVVRSIEYSPDGKLMVSAGDDKTVLVWDLEKRELVREFEGHSDSVFDVTISKNGMRLASCGADGTVFIWDLHSGKRLAKFQPNAGPVRCVRFFQKDNALAAGSEGRRFDFWQQQGNQWENKSLMPESGIRSLDVSPDNLILALGCDDNSIQLWDLKKQTELVILFGHSGRVNSVAFNSSGSLIATGDFNGAIRVWRANPIEIENQSKEQVENVGG